MGSSGPSAHRQTEEGEGQLRPEAVLTRIRFIKRANSEKLKRADHFRTGLRDPGFPDLLVTARSSLEGPRDSGGALLRPQAGGLFELPASS